MNDLTQEELEALVDAGIFPVSCSLCRHWMNNNRFSSIVATDSYPCAHCNPVTCFKNWEPKEDGDE